MIWYEIEIFLWNWTLWIVFYTIFPVFLLILWISSQFSWIYLVFSAFNENELNFRAIYLRFRIVCLFRHFTTHFVVTFWGFTYNPFCGYILRSHLSQIGTTFVKVKPYSGAIQNAITELHSCLGSQVMTRNVNAFDFEAIGTPFVYLYIKS